MKDNQPMLDLLWRTRFRWKLWPRHVTGDKKYGTEENLVAIEEQGIRAYIPIPDMDHRTEFLSAQEFTYEACLERVRAYQPTAAYKKALRKRQVWVEPLFAEGKDWHGMRRFRLRRLWRVNCEALMRAAGQNLKRLLTQRGWGRRPCPAEAVFCFFLTACRQLTRLFRSIGLFPRR
jgi:hypothetical protein